MCPVASAETPADTESPETPKWGLLGQKSSEDHWANGLQWAPKSLSKVLFKSLFVDCIRPTDPQRTFPPIAFLSNARSGLLAESSSEDFRLKCLRAKCPQQPFGSKALGPIVLTRLSAQKYSAQWSPGDFRCKCLHETSTEMHSARLSPEYFRSKGVSVNYPQKNFGRTVPGGIRPRCIPVKCPWKTFGVNAFSPKVLSDRWAKGPWRPLTQWSPATFGPVVLSDLSAKKK